MELWLVIMEGNEWMKSQSHDTNTDEVLLIHQNKHRTLPPDYCPPRTKHRKLSPLYWRFPCRWGWDTARRLYSDSRSGATDGRRLCQRPPRSSPTSGRSLFQWHIDDRLFVVLLVLLKYSDQTCPTSLWYSRGFLTCQLSSLRRSRSEKIRKKYVKVNDDLIIIDSLLINYN